VIDPFVTVEADVEIGEGTHLHPGAVVLNGARIGRNCTIHSGAVVAGVPQDLKFRGEHSLAIIGDGTTLRECATVNRGTASKGQTIVGSNCLIMAYSHVAHDCVVGSNVIIANASQVAGEVEIGDWAVIGGGSLIHQFSRIGAHVMMQGGSLVNKDVPPFTLCARYPISYAGVNIIGLRRRGFSAEVIGSIQEIYRIIFQSGLNTTEALAQVEATIPASAERDQILDFIRLSTRGILKGYN
jgi:UDP-N-acetylglucosamine acyltransferase